MFVPTQDYELQQNSKDLLSGNRETYNNSIISPNVWRLMWSIFYPWMLNRPLRIVYSYDNHLFKSWLFHTARCKICIQDKVSIVIRSLQMQGRRKHRKTEKNYTGRWFQKCLNKHTMLSITAGQTNRQGKMPGTLPCKSLNVSKSNSNNYCTAEH